MMTRQECLAEAERLAKQAVAYAVRRPDQAVLSARLAQVYATMALAIPGDRLHLLDEPRSWPFHLR